MERSDMTPAAACGAPIPTNVRSPVWPVSEANNNFFYIVYVTTHSCNYLYLPPVYRGVGG